MVTKAEVIANELFDKGKTPKEVHEILADMGMPKSSNRIYQYYAAHSRGESASNYVDKLYKLNTRCQSYLTEMGLTPDKRYDGCYMNNCGFLEFLDFLHEPDMNPLNENNPAALLLEALAGYGYSKEKLGNLIKNKDKRKGIKYVGKVREGLERYGFIAVTVLNGVRELTPKGKDAIETLKKYGNL